MIVVLVLAIVCVLLAGLVVLLAWAGVVDITCDRDPSWSMNLRAGRKSYTTIENIDVKSIEITFGRFYTQLVYGRWTR